MNEEKNETNWFGTDVNNEVSLFENGLLIRREGNMYKAIVWLGTGYAITSFDEQIIIDSLDDGLEDDDDSFPSWNDLADMNGMTVKEYRDSILNIKDRDSRALSILSDMISCYGVSDAIGIDANAKIYSEEEIKKVIGF